MWTLDHATKQGNELQVVFNSDDNRSESSVGRVCVWVCVCHRAVCLFITSYIAIAILNSVIARRRFSSYCAGLNNNQIKNAKKAFIKIIMKKKNHLTNFHLQLRKTF